MYSLIHILLFVSLKFNGTSKKENIVTVDNSRETSFICILAKYMGNDPGPMHSLLLLLLNCLSVATTAIELKTYELKTSKVLTVCQQLVLTAFRYPNLSKTTNGPHAC